MDSAGSEYPHGYPDRQICYGRNAAAIAQSRQRPGNDQGSDDIAGPGGHSSKGRCAAGSGGHVVFLAVDGVALQRRIKLGNAAGDSFVVLDGLAAGDLVIVRGNEGLVDGRKIKIGDPGKRPEDQRARNGR